MCEVRPSAIHGVGLFATCDMKENTRIAGYEGIEMTTTEFIAKYGRDYRHTYVMRRIQKIICGKGFENPSHYCNESLEPNVILKKRGLYTLRDVVAGEELCLRYPRDYPRDYVLE